MTTLVLFGAGNIGRGFIAPVFCAGGWRTVFIDIDAVRIAALHHRGRYVITEVTDAAAAVVEVGPVDGILATDSAAVAAAVAGADLLATAVGLGALRHLGANLAAGLARRWSAQAQGSELDILVCENGVQAPELLRRAILNHLPPELLPILAARTGFVRTSIGRMIPPADGSAADPLHIAVEPYAHLPLEATAFRGRPPRDVPGVELAADFELVLRQKLYLHNLSHACAAYRGQRLGLRDLPSCMADAGLVAGVRAASAEVSEALARAHGGGDALRQAAIRQECAALLDDLLQRYANRRLNDSVARVARDPLRKLAGDDRLIGAARLCLKHGVRPLALAHHILAATAYVPAADEPGADRFRSLQAQGWRSLLADTAQLAPEEPLMATLTLAARQQQAAQLIAKAGIYLKPDEATGIEIADFGLGRYDQLGLAIHVYCNTQRCCAKELAMGPGQICPEHRHPTVDGEPGKEETFRVRMGTVHMFLPGGKKEQIPAWKAEAEKFLPADKRGTVTVYQHYILNQGDQITLPPDTKHWFVAGAEGAVVSEFSTRSRDEADIFTDPAIQRVPVEGPHSG